MKTKLLAALLAVTSLTAFGGAISVPRNAAEFKELDKSLSIAEVFSSAQKTDTVVIRTESQEEAVNFKRWLTLKDASGCDVEKRSCLSLVSSMKRYQYKAVAVEVSDEFLVFLR